MQSVRQSEIEYCAKILKRYPDNEGPWRYLRGLFRDDKSGMVKDASVVALCIEILTADPQCIHCLSLVLDLLAVGFQPSMSTHANLLEALELTTVASPLELASLLCQRLEKLDAIRARYWAWRNTMLPPAEGIEHP